MLIDTLESSSSQSAKMDKKTYSSTTRMFIYDCIVNNTPTANIPVLISQFHKQIGREMDAVPQRSTVELMARELGAVAEECLQSDEKLLLIFDVFHAHRTEDI